MLNFRDQLYVGEDIHHQSRIIRNLKAGKRLLSTYVLATCEGPGQLEIYHNFFLTAPVYQAMEFDVVGIAGSYADALDLVLQITEECYASRGDANIKAYLGNKTS
ncbi:MAG: hypothetical protein K5682_04185 [Lachnospiraceae bacterium]|nr:hypothetical protein [Lachnospiraceae bacterium]